MRFGSVFGSRQVGQLGHAVPTCAVHVEESACVDRGGRSDSVGGCVLLWLGEAVVCSQPFCV
jgi:hypothetical protein